MDIYFTKVNVIGDIHINVFKMNDGLIVEQKISQTQYENNDLNPFIENGNWLNSYTRREVDTDNGKLSNGQYYEDGESCIIRNDDKIMSCPKSLIVDNKISQNDYDSLEKFIWQ